jgi:hypothetical protein
MKRNWQTRSLFLACILSAPLLAGAEGSCGGGKLPIGGNNPDGGSGAKGGTTGASGTGGTGTAGTGTAGTGTAGTGTAGTGTAGTGAAGTGTSGSGGSGGGGPDFCSLPPMTGTCEAALQRWAFNPQTGRCERFTYGGCDGNANNFETREACVAACVPGSGEPCGAARCADGQVCCNSSCGICTAPGDGCITMECPDGCAPQDARGEGACRQLLGYKWDGFACVALSGCDCVGFDCFTLSSSLQGCTWAHNGCDDQACATESRALTDFIAGNKSCATDADCRSGLNVGCGITEDDCTGAVYVNTRADLAAFEALRTDFFECTGGCSHCKRVNSGPACVDGGCTRMVPP